jgi:hypothetical protein
MDTNIKEYELRERVREETDREAETRDKPFINFDFVSGCDATHCKSAKALQTRLLACGVRVGGESIGYMLKISWINAAIVPNECHNTGAKSGNISRFLLNSNSAFSL